jgi:hypothetical protein
MGVLDFLSEIFKPITDLIDSLITKERVKE